ncbi:MAG: hypothetical protein WD928_12150 [Gammaproteobacteria bacterium]
MSAVLETRQTVSFPSPEFFQALAGIMNANRARQEQLGYIDCVAVFTITDGAGGGKARHFRVIFEEFAALEAREIDDAMADEADFALAGDLATWCSMLQSIVVGNGRPGLEQTLNRLSHMGTPMKLVAGDPLKADLFFRYNQSLQEFINAASALDIRFANPG